MSHLLFALGLVAYCALTYLVVDIARATVRHFSKGNEFHPMPLPLHYSLLVAVIEVCWDRPRALHHSRMEVVRRAEQRRAVATEEERRARLRCMANHPSAMRSINNSLPPTDNEPPLIVA